MEELLALEQVTYTYEGEHPDRPALRDCSLTICRGEKIAVVGSNGAGKSTFFLLANGVLHPQWGTVRLAGQPVGKRELGALRRAVGLVFQDPDVQLLGGTVEEEISFGPMNLGLARSEVLRRVDASIAALDLEPLRHRAPHTLSGGEKKRVTIADVLAMEPGLLLLDEPSASLDPTGRRLLEETLEQLHESHLALAVATHDLDFVWRWAERVLVFSGGALEADITPTALFADEDLLRRCGLELPLLLQVAQSLGLKEPPRTVEDLTAMISREKVDERVDPTSGKREE